MVSAIEAADRLTGSECAQVFRREICEALGEHARIGIAHPENDSGSSVREKGSVNLRIAPLKLHQILMSEKEPHRVLPSGGKN